MQDERQNNETQCFPQFDELFHLEYIYFNFRDWMLNNTASENIDSVCNMYSLDVWEKCSYEGMLIGTCFYLFDWVPVYVGISRAFANKVLNVFKALQYALQRLILQIPNEQQTEAAQRVELVCFIGVGAPHITWILLMFMVFVFVFVVFDSITFACLNLVLMPVYMVLTTVNAMPPLPAAQRDVTTDAVAELVLKNRQQKAD
jgi:hypothetical protein